MLRKILTEIFLEFNWKVAYNNQGLGYYEEKGYDGLL